YTHGLGTHADSEVRVTTTSPAKRFHAWVGVDRNHATLSYHGDLAKLIFSLESGGKQIWASPPQTIDDQAYEVDVPLPNLTEFTLKVHAVDNMISYAHADWGDAQVECAGGKMYWVGETLAEQQLPKKEPFAFTYDGKSSDDFLATWQAAAKTSTLSKDVTLHTKTYHDPATGLTVIEELKQYSQNPATEWVLRLRNDGKQNTPIIENVLPLRLDWTASSADNFLHRSHGSHGEINDFRYQVDPVPPTEPGLTPTDFEMIAGGGRSSDNWMPYYNLQTGDSGVVVAIGWSGQWSASITRGYEDRIPLTAGLQKMHFSLAPGEEIRTPSIALVFWNGQAINGSNNLRKFIIDHHSPRVDGKLQTPPLTHGAWGGVKDVTTLGAIQHIKDLGLKYDYFWIDAGWYGAAEGFSEQEASAKWYDQVGSWNPNPIAHPHGMRPISDAAHAAGMKFLLWFEPERAMLGTTLPTEHPDWFLSLGDSSDKRRLLNLGNPEALKWLIEFTSTMIKDYRVDCLRQDFNVAPLEFWQKADTPDRMGLTETKHIMGLYAFWDELRRRFPNLLIDNCASGGRRLDIELAGRAIPLWRSDYLSLGGENPLGVQLHTLGLSYWLPLHGTTPQSRPGDLYNFHGALSAAMGLGVPDDLTHYSLAYHRARMADYNRARPYYEGSYYPLTPYSSEENVWGAYQMHRDDLGGGLLVALRRAACPYSSATFPLSGLDPAAQYAFEDTVSGKKWRMSGQEAMEKGVAITLEPPKSSVLLFYGKVGR
ncbi:MAG: hypothetical protein JWQ02_14, partial [Capsulimonas sp.]|nr:hypothetical protein [Capsulimonas sp.]